MLLVTTRTSTQKIWITTLNKVIAIFRTLHSSKCFWVWHTLCFQYDAYWTRPSVLYCRVERTGFQFGHTEINYQNRFYCTHAYGSTTLWMGAYDADSQLFRKFLTDVLDKFQSSHRENPWHPDIALFSVQDLKYLLREALKSGQEQWLGPDFFSQTNRNCPTCKPRPSFFFENCQETNHDPQPPYRAFFSQCEP